MKDLDDELLSILEQNKSSALLHNLKDDPEMRACIDCGIKITDPNNTPFLSVIPGHVGERTYYCDPCLRLQEAASRQKLNEMSRNLEGDL